MGTKYSTQENFIYALLSICIHIIIFLVLNIMPHNNLSLSWKHISKVSQRGINDKLFKNMEIINLTASNENKDQKTKPADKVEKKDKVKYITPFKSNLKVDFANNKEEPNKEKLVFEKRIAEIKNPTSSKNLTFVPPIKVTRGIRSISEKSPLTSHLEEKNVEMKSEIEAKEIEQPLPLVPVGDEKLSKAYNRIIDDKIINPKEIQVDKKSEEKRPEKIKVQSEKERALIQDNFLKQDREANIKKEIKTIKSNKIADISSKEEPDRKKIESQALIKDVEKNIRMSESKLVINQDALIKTLEKIKEIELDDADVILEARGDKKSGKIFRKTLEQKIVKDINRILKKIESKTAEKIELKSNKVSSDARSNAAKQILISEAKSKKEISSIKIANKSLSDSGIEDPEVQKSDIPTITTELENKIKKVGFEHKLYPGSAQGTLEANMKNITGFEPIPVNPKGYEKIANAKYSENKSIASANDKLDKNFDVKKIQKIEVENKKEKNIKSGSFAKQQVVIKSNIKEVSKAIPVKHVSQKEEYNEQIEDFMELNNLLKKIDKETLAVAGLITEQKTFNNEIQEIANDKEDVPIDYEEEKKMSKINQKITKEYIKVAKVSDDNSAPKILEKVEITKDKDISQKQNNISKNFKYKAKLKEEANIPAKQIANGIKTDSNNDNVKAVKRERVLDRNPMNASRSKTVPLTVVSRGGQVTMNTKEKYTYEEMKKIEKKIKNMNKDEIYFSPSVKKSDIKILLDKKDIESKYPERERVEKRENLTPAVKQAVIVKEIVKQQETKPEISVEQKPKIEIEKKPIIESEQKNIKQESTDKKEIVEKNQIKDIVKKNIKIFEKEQGKIKAFKEMEVSKAKIGDNDKHKVPNIVFISHNAARTLGKGDELEVVLEGDRGNIAYFDIGLYHTKISLTEVSPGIYRGVYRVIDGDNVNNAPVIGYLTDKEYNQSFMVASKAINIDTTPGITIATPTGTSVDNEMQSVTGIVDDSKVKNVVLSVNSDRHVVQVENGFFKFDVKLKRGKNIIEVKCEDSKGIVRVDRKEVDFSVYMETGIKVTITSPSDGEIVNLLENQMVEICGSVSDPLITTAKLTGNNLSMDIKVINGYFSQKVVPVGKVNSYVVEAKNKAGEFGISEPVTVTTIGLRLYDVIIALNWNVPDADMDLVLRNPEGKSISHKSRTSDVPKSKIALSDKRGDIMYNLNSDALSAKLEWYNNDKLVRNEIVFIRPAISGVYTILSRNFKSTRPVSATLSIRFNETKNSARLNVRQFGPKTLDINDEWEITLLCLPKD
ncbi:hypothetical protein HZA55_05305 [Candidatus Poribacteria bacterium]|nr:hypothetical protein [Candidatus Poribacteria bacterium]